jgi:hypothetical protein
VSRHLSLPLVAIAALAFPATAAAYEEFPGTRVLGMGGASRAFAIGDSGPMLNPSGMALVKTYNIEGAYGYGTRLNDHSFHASAVDNTSAFNIAAGVYYTHHLAGPPVVAGAAPLSGSGHAGGVALAIPMTPFAAIGGTVKYLRLEGADAPGGHAGGVTFDLGATVRPHQLVSFALVGRNLRTLHNSHAPKGIAYGVALLPIPGLIIAADGVTHFTADNLSGRKGTSVMAGGELTFGGKFALRAGGGYDAVTGNGYASAGASLVSELAALDGGLRQDIVLDEASPRVTIIGISVRIFVPASQTQPHQ